MKKVPQYLQSCVGPEAGMGAMDWDGTVGMWGSSCRATGTADPGTHGVRLFALPATGAAPLPTLPLL